MNADSKVVVTIKVDGKEFVTAPVSYSSTDHIVMGIEYPRAIRLPLKDLTEMILSFELARRAVFIIKEV